MIHIACHCWFFSGFWQGHNKRFLTLISLMLASQTKNKVTDAAGQALCWAQSHAQPWGSSSYQGAGHCNWPSTPSVDQGQRLLQFGIKYIGTVFLCISRINRYCTCHCGLVHSHIIAASHNCLCLSIQKSGMLDFWFHFFFLCNKPGILTCIVV